MEPESYRFIPIMSLGAPGFLKNTVGREGFKLIKKKMIKVSLNVMIIPITDSKMIKYR
jgi:hypothetical protein